MNAQSFPKVWTDSFAARQILAACDRKDFHQSPRPAMWGEDHFDWVSSNEKGDALVAELHVLREREMVKRTGFADYSEAWAVSGEAGGRAMIDAHNALPTISDALEAEFARREGRGIKVRVRPTEAEVEALKAFIALPIMERRAH